MSFVDDLLDKIGKEGEKLIEKEGDDWVEKLIEGGRSNKGEIVSLVSGVLPGSETLTEEGVDEVLDILVDNAKPFIRLTSIGFTRLVGYYDTGEDEEARNLYMATQATFWERRAWVSAGGDMAQHDREERDRNWAEIESVMKQIGEVGLKILLAAAKLFIGI